MICTPHQVLFGGKIENNEMDGACSTYGGEERCIQGLGEETYGKENTWKTLLSMGDNKKLYL
jgi:hypothetical protein